MKAHRHTIETFVEVFVVDAKLRKINVPLRVLWIRTSSVLEGRFPFLAFFYRQDFGFPFLAILWCESACQLDECCLMRIGGK